MDQDTFCAAGKLLFGKHWISGMADALNVSHRHASRLASGQTPISPGIREEVITLLGQRKSALAAFLLANQSRR